MEKIIDDAKKYCVQLLSKSRCGGLPFHNTQHTNEVYDNSMKIGEYEHISVKELEPVLLAALFHDTGNADIFKDHENFSIEQAMKFLQERNYPNGKIATVIDCIDATRMPQKPQTNLQNIICDADLHHLGTYTFQKKNRALRKEWSKYLDVTYTDEAWLEMNVDFLSKHHFHTSYGKDILEPIKQENLRAVKSQLKELKIH